MAHLSGILAPGGPFQLLSVPPEARRDPRVSCRYRDATPRAGCPATGAAHRPPRSSAWA